MGAQETRPLVLDAGALIAVEKADRRVLALIAVAVDLRQLDPAIDTHRA